MRRRILYYGWFDRRARVYRISLLPPDAPVRPSLAFESRAELAAVLERKRWDVMWLPPLTEEQAA